MQQSKMQPVAESGKQTGVLPQQHQHGAAPAHLLSTRHRERCLSGPLREIFYSLTQLKIILAEKVAIFLKVNELS